MANKKSYHFLYKTTNLINNKYYYGVHSTKKLNDGYLGSGKYLKRSINKYGKENFNLQIVEFFTNKENMLEKEKEIVNEKILLDNNCMNLRPGGFGGFSLKEQSENAKKSNAKQKLLKETNKEWFDTKCKNISIGNKKAYDEGRRVKGVFCDWTGKKHSEKSKIEIGKKNSITQKGEKNSQFGTCWIYNENKNKKIKKEELENYLKSGWIKGRKN